MTILDILKTARGIIAEPERWTQGAMARRENGFITEPESERATCWCVQGAIRAATIRLKLPFQMALAAERFAATSTGLPETQAMSGPLAVFNDGNGHGEVLALLDAAIEKGMTS